MKHGLKSIVCAALLCITTSCAGLGQLMTGPPPTAAVLNSTSIDEAGIDLIRDLFDVALYGVEALPLKPGSPEAVKVARLIRQIAGFLGAADAAQKAGSAATYNEALRNARTALTQFQQAIGMGRTTLLQLHAAPQVRQFAASLDDRSRLAIADRLDPSNHGGQIALR